MGNNTIDRTSYVLGVIPARSGSKGIPRKNLHPLAGEPLIVHTIRASLAARSLSRLIVSTDDLEIAEVSRSHGAEVPFLRPEELSRDDTPGMAPLLHAIRNHEATHGFTPEWLVCLQPTSPFRTGSDIDAAIALARSSGAEAVVSVMETPFLPAWFQKIDEKGRMLPYLPELPLTALRQQAQPAYVLNGALYVLRCDTFLEKGTWVGGDVVAYVMPPTRSVDIDSPWDLEWAEFLFRTRSGERQHAGS